MNLGAVRLSQGGKIDPNNRFADTVSMQRTVGYGGLDSALEDALHPSAHLENTTATKYFWRQTCRSGFSTRGAGPVSGRLLRTLDWDLR